MPSWTPPTVLLGARRAKQQVVLAFRGGSRARDCPARLGLAVRPRCGCKFVAVGGAMGKWCAPRDWNAPRARQLAIYGVLFGDSAKSCGADVGKRVDRGKVEATSPEKGSRPRYLLMRRGGPGKFFLSQLWRGPAFAGRLESQVERKIAHRPIGSASQHGAGTEQRRLLR